eukprot:170163_1
MFLSKSTKKFPMSAQRLEYPLFWDNTEIINIVVIYVSIFLILLIFICHYICYQLTIKEAIKLLTKHKHIHQYLTTQKCLYGLHGIPTVITNIILSYYIHTKISNIIETNITEVKNKTKQKFYKQVALCIFIVFLIICTFYNMKFLVINYTVQDKYKNMVSCTYHWQTRRSGYYGHRAVGMGWTVDNGEYLCAEQTIDDTNEFEPSIENAHSGEIYSSVSAKHWCFVNESCTELTVNENPCPSRLCSYCKDCERGDCCCCGENFQCCKICGGCNCCGCCLCCKRLDTKRCCPAFGIWSGLQVVISTCCRLSMYFQGKSKVKTDEYVSQKIRLIVNTTNSNYSHESHMFLLGENRKR